MEYKFFLNLLVSDTTNIAKDIFSIPKDVIHKMQHQVTDFEQNINSDKLKEKSATFMFMKFGLLNLSY